MKGMGELHLEIIVDRMQREFKVGANVGGPVLIPVERNHAVSLCAAPQTP